MGSKFLILPTAKYWVKDEASCLKIASDNILPSQGCYTPQG